MHCRSKQTVEEGKEWERRDTKPRGAGAKMTLQVNLLPRFGSGSISCLIRSCALSDNMDHFGCFSSAVMQTDHGQQHATIHVR